MLKRALGLTFVLSISVLISACGSSGNVKSQSSSGKQASTSSKQTDAKTAANKETEKPKKELTWQERGLPMAPEDHPKPIKADIDVVRNTRIIAGFKVIENSYLKKNQSLPDVAKVLSYGTEFESGNSTSPSGSKALVSSCEVVNAKDNRKPVIEEKFELYKGNQLIKSMKERINVSPPTSGVFQSKYTITLPADMPKGDYIAKTSLFVEGKQEKTTSQTLIVK